MANKGALGVLQCNGGSSYSWIRSAHYKSFLRMTVGGFLLYGATAATAQEPKLVLNEAMANEPESATSLEWVEVLNWPDSGDGVIDLLGYRFIDDDTTVFDTNLLIPPGGFLILASKPVGTSSFEEYWGDNSGVWGDTNNEDFPVVTVKMSLSNVFDVITLVSPSGDHSVLSWAGESDDGVSMERIHPNRGFNPDNVVPCVDPSGSTPGRPNSVLVAPNTLAVTFASLPELADWGDILTSTVFVENVGLGRSTEATVSLLDDIVPSTPQFEARGVADASVPPLEEGEDTHVNLSWGDATPGRHRVLFCVHHDGDTTFQPDSRILTVRHSQPLVIITEFLANPDDGPGEWIEISNRADFPIDMTFTRITDGVTSGILLPMAGMIEPDAYWVLAQDESQFRSYYGDFDGLVMPVSVWPNLNNDGDLIRLKGAGGELIDSVVYTRVYDNNRSVERLTLSPTFASADDWTASVDPSGATPGRANSVNRDLAGSLQVSVSPNPIYLSRAGVAEIEYRLEVGARLTLKIFNREGQLVRTIADETLSATGVMTWDGTDDDGAAVRPGPYVLFARSDPGGDVVKKVIVVGP